MNVTSAVKSLHSFLRLTSSSSTIVASFPCLSIRKRPICFLGGEFYSKRALATMAHHEAEKVVIPVEEATRFIVECMESVGTSKQHAKQLADVLVMGDHRGHFSHGLNRLGSFCCLFDNLFIYL